jgi:hypothetical protein
MNELANVPIGKGFDVIQFLVETHSERTFKRQLVDKVSGCSNSVFGYTSSREKLFPFALEFVFANHRGLQKLT